ncbi:DUF418 domain-containing protein [Salinispirillum marinum]|uniref:DUF418 domain-containing protein n=2 Tax=Saccharospirillaceae TaxID=255527 RepID=A0ABV8BBB6_9GAMM
MTTLSDSVDNTRFVKLDLIRGVAVLGVLMVNIHLFSGPEQWHYHPSQRPDLSGLDQGALVLTIGLMEGKFIALLSLLFGVGMALFLERYGQIAKWAHMKRMAILGCIGLLHAYGFWYGDILVTYAITGAVAWWFLPLSPLRQIRFAVLFFALPTGLLLWAAQSVDRWDEATLQTMRALLYPSAETLQAKVMGYQQGFWAQWSVRAPDAWTLQFDVLVTWTLWYTLSLMIIGMLLQRQGWCVAPPIKPISWPGIGIGTVGLVLSLGVALSRVFGVPDDLAWVSFYQPVLQQMGAFLLAFWYLLVLLSWSSASVWVLRLAALGRWSLSVYLLQSLLCGVLFYGHGLGWYGQRTPAEVMLLGAGISALLLWQVPKWEKCWGIGPAERLWRRAVKRPPIDARNVT